MKTVLITGAAGGIGSSTVSQFLEEGWQVIGVDKQIISDRHTESWQFYQADISKPESLAEIFKSLDDKINYLDVLINNAALQIAKPLLETSVDEWDLIMATNLRSVFLMSKYAHPLLKANGGGAIVNVSSVHAVATSANISAYAASKGGLLALTRAMAIEFAPDEIRVNAILPGAVDTPMLRAGLNRGQPGIEDVHVRLENLAMNTVSGRIGTPEEISKSIMFLADSNKSSFMTGQAMIVDGGATARLSTE